MTERNPQESYVELASDVNDPVPRQKPNVVRDAHGARETGTMPKTKGNVKEVWFVGSHSICTFYFLLTLSFQSHCRQRWRKCTKHAGTVALDKFGPPLRWMVYEGQQNGLLVESLGGTVTWVPSLYNNSMTGIWKLLEAVPIRRLSYKNKQATKKW